MNQAEIKQKRIHYSHDRLSMDVFIHRIRNRMLAKSHTNVNSPGFAFWNCILHFIRFWRNPESKSYWKYRGHGIILVIFSNSHRRYCLVRYYFSKHGRALAWIWCNRVLSWFIMRIVGHIIKQRFNKRSKSLAMYGDLSL